MGTLAHARGAQATAPTTLGQAEGAAQAAHAGGTSLPPPVAVDYALPDQAPSSAPSGDDRESSRPVTPARSGSSKDHTSPRKPTYHYKHHEPAPRRLLKRLNSLVHGGKPHRKHSHPSSSAVSSRPGSVLSSLRSSHAPTPLTAEPAPLSPPPPPPAPAEATRPSIKIRLVTFNMHDSLPSPSGDLSEFLGDVSLFPEEHLPRKRPRGGSRSSRGSTVTVPLPDADEDGEALPSFPLTEGHPYHIVVVCGQECPTASGVLAGKVPRLDGKGWTSLLEAYLCGGCSHSSSPSESSASSDDGASDAEAGDEGASARAPSGGSRSRSRGPYVLVEKERLMGIYCAVFVARCCEGLVKGASTGRVTAGLMGGRMGNKGGVGISLHLHHTRLLFVSAHLAAHASGLEFRKANAAKILDELVVDDFWAQSGKEGPRPEKLVERFDAVFFAGDLNFRLNISRLHADWLVRGRDYTTALRFDQLRDVLASSASGGCFSGFAEGEIAFPPTYKYDVPARKKKRRGTLLRLAAGGGGGGGGGGGKATGGREGAATDPEVPLSSVPGTPRPAPAGGFGGGGGAWTPGATTATDDDALSIVSSIGTMSTLDADCADPLLDAPEAVAAREDLASLGLPPAPGKGGETGLDAVRKAQVRFLTLVKRNSNAAAMEYAKRARDTSEGAGGAGAGGRGRRSTLSGLFPPRPILRSSQSAVVVPTTTISACTEEESDEGAEDTKTLDEAAAPASVSAVEPVFDSSKKQRVQSWTDRILFHSSAPPPSPPPAAPSPALAPPLLPVASPDGASSPPRRPASANEVRHPRFEPPSPSSDSLARSPSSPSLDEHPSLWRRVKSTVFDSPDAPEAAPAAPPRRPRPRKRFTLSGDSSSSSDEAEGLSRRTGPSVTPERPDLPHSASDSPAPSAPPNASASASGTGFPRARTFSAALNALHDRAPGALALGHAHTQSASSTSPSASGTSLNTRLRSFLSLLPLPPFLSTPARPAPLPAQEAVKREPSGPRRGEVQVLKYDCVRDLARMGAVSDHRPVFLVCALGVEEEEEEEERAAGGGV